MTLSVIRTPIVPLNTKFQLRFPNCQYSLYCCYMFLLGETKVVCMTSMVEDCSKFVSGVSLVLLFPLLILICINFAIVNYEHEYNSSLEFCESFYWVIKPEGAWTRRVVSELQRFIHVQFSVLFLLASSFPYMYILQLMDIFGCFWLFSNYR